MNICFIDFGYYTLKDVLTPLYEYSKFLSGQGHSVAIFVRKSKETIKGSGNLKIIEVCGEYFGTKIAHLFFLMKLVFMLQKNKFDVVHIFNFPGMALLPILCKKQHRKWILDIQTGRIEKSFIKLIYDGITVWEAGFFDNIFILSSELRDSLFRGKKIKSSYIIPIGANLERIKEAKQDRSIWYKHGLSGDDVIMVYLGHLQRFRKLENMLESFKIVSAHLKEKKVKLAKLVIIGGNDADIETLENKARRMGISGQVMFLGKISYESVPEYLVNSDLGLAYVPKTDLFDAQPPLKTFEYLAASLAVVATDTTANKHIISDGVNGVLTTDDPRGFADGIIRLLDNSELMSQVRKKAPDSIKNHDWEVIVKRVTEIYLL